MSSLTATFAPLSLPRSTSGDGILRHAQDLLISVCGSLATGTSASARMMVPLEFYAPAQTNSGVMLTQPETSRAAAIQELRRRSGLTWDELAGLFGVSRRSVHFWASGKPMSPSHEVELNGLLHAVRYIDRGAGTATRAVLTSMQVDGSTPLDHLAAGRWREVMSQLGQGGGSGAVARTPLNAVAHPLWVPPSPDRLVDAVHETAHRNAGRARAGRSVKIKKAP
jgi:DNA-binding XRE family transcriptional regulator